MYNARSLQTTSSWQSEQQSMREIIQLFKGYYHSTSVSILPVAITPANNRKNTHERRLGNSPFLFMFPIRKFDTRFGLPISVLIYSI